MDPTDPLGPLETRVLDALWDRGPATSREVCEALGEDRAYTTIMTTLDRLHHKGLLEREKHGIAWRYRPALSREAHERAVADALVARILADHREAGIAAFVEAAAQDAALLDALAASLAARRGKG